MYGQHVQDAKGEFNEHNIQTGCRNIRSDRFRDDFRPQRQRGVWQYFRTTDGVHPEIVVAVRNGFR